MASGTPSMSELGTAFAEACRGDTPNSASELHDATAKLVRRLTAEGNPPERVIATVKEALTRYGGIHVPPSLVDDENALGEPQATAYRRVFGWCLDVLFEET